jgi:hypothetical protein
MREEGVYMGIYGACGKKKRAMGSCAYGGWIGSLGDRREGGRESCIRGLWRSQEITEQVITVELVLKPWKTKKSSLVHKVPSKERNKKKH